MCSPTWCRTTALENLLPKLMRAVPRVGQAPPVQRSLGVERWKGGDRPRQGQVCVVRLVVQINGSRRCCTRVPNKEAPEEGRSTFDPREPSGDPSTVELFNAMSEKQVFTKTGCWFDMQNTGHPSYCKGWRRRKTVSGIVRLPVSRPKK